MREKPLTAVALGGLTLAVYLATLYTTVPGGDSGELITAAHLLGVAHPPGYPLYTLLAKAFTGIPFGGIAWRVNLFSAVCDALAAALLCLGVGRWTGSRPAGWLAGGLFAFSPLVWNYAIAAEVFALNNLLLSAALYLAVRYAENHEERFARWGAFTLGLAMSNQQTSAFLALPLAAWAIALGWGQGRETRRLCILAAAFLAGLLPYLYLPLAGARNLPVSWGDTATWNGFWTHVLRREYGTFRLLPAGGAVAWLDSLKHYALASLRELSFVGLPLAALGAAFRIRREGGQGLTALAAGAWLFYVLAFHAFANADLSDPLVLGVLQRFWQQPHLLVCAFAGIALAEGLAFFRPRRPAAWAWGLALAAVAATLAVNYRAEDRHRNDYVDRFARASLGSLPPDALLFSRGDLDTNAMKYLMYCEGFRTDVRLLDRVWLEHHWMMARLARGFPGLRLPPAERFTLGDLMAVNLGYAPIFMSEPELSEDRSWEKRFHAFADGFVNRIFPADGRPVDLAERLRESRRALAGFDPGLPADSPADGWETFIWRRKYWEVDQRAALWLFAYAAKLPESELRQSAEAFRLGAEEMRALLARHPDPPPRLLKNFGLALYRLSRFDPRAEPEMARIWTRYLELAPAGDPEIPWITNKVAEAAAK